jgi:hypothetical protein
MEYRNDFAFRFEIYLTAVVVTFGWGVYVMMPSVSRAYGNISVLRACGNILWDA